MNRKDLKINLIFLYLLCNFVFFLYRFGRYFYHYISTPVALVFQFIALVTVVTALVCYYKKESYSWYLTFYTILWWPLCYSALFYKVLMRSVVSGGGGLGEFMAANLFILFFTVIGFLFAFLLIDKEVRSSFKLSKVNYVALLTYVISIFLYNIALG